MQNELILNVGEKSTQREVGKDLIKCVYNAYIERCNQSNCTHKIGGLVVTLDTQTNGKVDAYILNARDMAMGHKLALLAHPECFEDLMNGKPIPEVIFEMIVEPFLCMINTIQHQQHFEKKIINVELYTSCNDELFGQDKPVMFIEDDGEEISEGRVC